MWQRAVVVTLAATLSISPLARSQGVRADDGAAPPPKERRASVVIADQKAAVDRVHAERTRRRDAEARLEQWRQAPPADAPVSARRALESARGTRASADRRRTP